MKQEYKIRKWKHIEKSAWNKNKDSFPLCQTKQETQLNTMFPPSGAKGVFYY